MTSTIWYNFCIILGRDHRFGELGSHIKFNGKFKIHVIKDCEAFLWDKMRNWRKGFHDLVMDTYYGLHHFRLHFRPLNYEDRGLRFASTTTNWQFPA